MLKIKEIISIVSKYYLTGRIISVGQFWTCILIANTFFISKSEKPDQFFLLLLTLYKERQLYTGV